MLNATKAMNRLFDLTINNWDVFMIDREFLLMVLFGEQRTTINGRFITTYDDDNNLNSYLNTPSVLDWRGAYFWYDHGEFIRIKRTSRRVKRS